jgi:nucleotide-binding universal stress UspA family protein
MKHILIASDLSAEALRPFEPVTHLARAMKAKVTVLHVVQDLVIAPHGTPLAPPIGSPDLSGEMDSARKELAAACKGLGDVPDLHCEVISGVQIPAAINSYAEDNEVDLIAISTHGRSGWRHLVLGSVAESVLRNSNVPVLTFPRDKK